MKKGAGASAAQPEDTTSAPQKRPSENNQAGAPSTTTVLPTATVTAQPKRNPWKQLAKSTQSTHLAGKERDFPSIGDEASASQPRKPPKEASLGGKAKGKRAKGKPASELLNFKYGPRGRNASRPKKADKGGKGPKTSGSGSVSPDVNATVKSDAKAGQAGSKDAADGGRKDKANAQKRSPGPGGKARSPAGSVHAPSGNSAEQRNKQKQQRKGQGRGGGRSQQQGRGRRNNGMNRGRQRGRGRADANWRGGGFRPPFNQQQFQGIPPPNPQGMYPMPGMQPYGQPMMYPGQMMGQPWQWHQMPPPGPQPHMQGRRGRKKGKRGGRSPNEEHMMPQFAMPLQGQMMPGLPPYQMQPYGQMPMGPYAFNPNFQPPPMGYNPMHQMQGLNLQQGPAPALANSSSPTTQLPSDSGASDATGSIASPTPPASAAAVGGVPGQRSPADTFEPPHGIHYGVDVTCVATGYKPQDRVMGQIAVVGPISNAIPSYKIELNIYLKPQQEVISYNTSSTSLNKEVLDMYGMDPNESVRLVRTVIPKDAVLVGHGIRRTIQRLGLVKGTDYKDSVDLAHLWKVWNPQYANYTMFTLQHEAQCILGIPAQQPNAILNSILSFQLYGTYLQLRQNPSKLEHAKRLLVSTPPIRSFAKSNQLELEDPEQIKKAVLTQVEYYFGDENLPTDGFLLKLTRSNPSGWVPVAKIASFNRIRALTMDINLVVEALKMSSVVEISNDLLFIRVAEPDAKASEPAANAEEANAKSSSPSTETKAQAQT